MSKPRVLYGVVLPGFGLRDGVQVETWDFSWSDQLYDDVNEAQTELQMAFADGWDDAQIAVVHIGGAA